MNTLYKGDKDKDDDVNNNNLLLHLGYILKLVMGCKIYPSLIFLPFHSFYGEETCGVLFLHIHSLISEIFLLPLKLYNCYVNFIPILSLITVPIRVPQGFKM